MAMDYIPQQDMSGDWDPGADPSALPRGFDDLPVDWFLGATLNGIDPTTLSAYDRVCLLTAYDRLVSHFQAQRASAMIAVVEANGWDEFASLEIAPALHLTNLGANSELGVAAQLHRLPEVHALLARGDLDWRRTRAVLDAVDHLDDEAARAVVADVAEQLTSLTTGQIRSLIRRRCITLDPDDAVRRLDEAVTNRRVDVYPTGEGTASMVLSDLPPERAAAAMAHIEDLARKLPKDDRTVEQRRVDVALDLLTGHGTPTGRGTVDLTVGLTTIMSLDQQPGTIGGWGPVVAEIARSVVESQVDVNWQATVTLPDGALHTVALRRRPTASQARQVRTRFSHCVFPGCRQPARHADVDHTVDHQFGGATAVENLAPLCRRHHRAKHETAWSYRVEDDTVHWTSPSGHHYTAPTRGP